MREGSLDAPVRHPIDWQDPDFTDRETLDAEMRRVFDVCHTCRRCFNLCDSFPRLFDLIDTSETMELDAVESEDFKTVVDACTLCDMCFMTKCPYVPPHEFNIDFPHLMLRYRVAEHKEGKTPFVERQLAETDRNGELSRPVAPLVNWATRTGNKPVRTLLERIAHVHRDASLPEFHSRTLETLDKSAAPDVDRDAPGFGRKVVLYATCYGNYNNPRMGLATRAVLAHNGVETKVVYPACCGMPKFEKGDLAAVTKNAETVVKTLMPWIDDGYEVVALMPSCALMLKFEWPLLLPNRNDIERLARATFDVSEYIVRLAKTVGLAPALKPLDGGISIHLACHSRAQNMGPKATEMMQLIPDTELHQIERCSGHGGSWGVMRENFEVALKMGRPVAGAMTAESKRYVVSECPLAAEHIRQGMAKIDAAKAPERTYHPIELLAQSYALNY